MAQSALFFTFVQIGFCGSLATAQLIESDADAQLLSNIQAIRFTAEDSNGEAEKRDAHHRVDNQMVTIESIFNGGHAAMDYALAPLVDEAGRLVKTVAVEAAPLRDPVPEVKKAPTLSKTLPVSVKPEPIIEGNTLPVATLVATTPTVNPPAVPESHVPDDVSSYSASFSRQLESTDLQGLSRAQLTMMRNEIYARHSYIFASETLRTHFGQKAWYKPLYRDVSDKLTPIELENITLIKKFEKLKSR